MYNILAELMVMQGVTPYRLSKETGITQATLSRWKNGITQPSIETLQTLADYFGVTVDYLTGNESQRYQPTKELLDLRKDLGQDFKLQIFIKDMTICKELENGYYLVVIGTSFDAYYGGLTVEVWNYAYQPFVHERVSEIANIETLKNVLKQFEDKYKALPRLKEIPEKVQKNKLIAESNEPIELLDILKNEESLMFNGDPLSDSDRESIIAAITMAKQIIDKSRNQ